MRDERNRFLNSRVLVPIEKSVLTNLVSEPLQPHSLDPTVELPVLDWIMFLSRNRKKEFVPCSDRVGWIRGGCGF